MKQLFMEYDRQMLRQFGLQRSFYRSPSLHKPMQGIMEKDDRPEEVVYDSGDHLPDHLHQPNKPLYPLTSWGEDCGDPVHFHRYSPLSERQLRHTYQASHLVLSIFLYHVVSLNHIFRCYAHIPDRPNALPAWRLCTTDSI